MALYEILPDSLRALDSTTFGEAKLRERQDLQRLLRDHIEVIAPGVLVVAEEYGEWEDSRRRIDLLGVDKDANLVVIELKRTEDGGHMELQAIRYAAMVSTMTFDQTVEALSNLMETHEREGDARQRLLKHLNWDEPKEDRFGQEVRIILASADFSRELTSAVLWLNDRQLSIECFRLSPYRDGDKILLDVQQVIPLPEATDYQVRVKTKQQLERTSRKARPDWTGVWYVQVGMDDSNARDWNRCREHGFLSAGGGPWYTNSLHRLEKGDLVAAYQRGKGYLGIGHVSTTAKPITEFTGENNISFNQLFPKLHRSKDEPEKFEHVIGINWIQTVSESHAKWFTGAFAKQHIACKLTDPDTLNLLRTEFGLVDQSQD